MIGLRGTALLVVVSAAAAGTAPPGLTPVDEAGFQKMVAARKGRVVLVDFWATWCDACRKEMPGLVAMSGRLKAQGLELVTVSADEPEQEAGAQAFLAKTGAPAATAYVKRARDDDKFINSVDPKWSGALPALFLYDRAGRKARSFIGETPMKDVEAAVAQLLK